MKKYLLIVGLVFISLNFLFAQKPKPKQKEAPPTQKEMEAMMKEMQGAMDEMSDEEKKNDGQHGH